MDCFVYKRLVIWGVVVWKNLNGLVKKHQKKGRSHGVFGFVLRRVQRSIAFALVKLFAHMFSHVSIFSKCSCWKYSLILGISVMTLYCIHPSWSQLHFPDMLDSRCQKEQSTPLQEDFSKWLTTTTTTTTSTTTRTTTTSTTPTFNFNTTTSTLEANWNMSREMFVGCVDVTAHCKPVHNVHPWYACVIDEFCIAFTTDTLICGCFTSMVSIFNFSASPAPTHRCTVTHHHVLRAHKIVCVWFVKISIRFRCILWGGGSDDRGPSLAVGQGFDSIPNLKKSYYINRTRMAQESAIKVILGEKAERAYFYPMWMVWLFGKGLPNATNYHLKRLHRSSNLLHPDTTDMPEIIYIHIHLNSYAIISMKKKVGQSI